MVMSWPSAAQAGKSQEDRARPPTSTKHAPHSPTPQPNLGPDSPRSCRSTSRRGASGSHWMTRSVPFTVARILTVAMGTEYAFVCRDEARAREAIYG